jgi:hypothetical protein
VTRKTAKKRLRTRRHAVKERPAVIRRRPIREQGAWRGGVLAGYFQYFAAPGNLPARSAFRDQATRLRCRSLRRRSPRHRLNWDRFGPLVKRHLPIPRVLHRYPNDRSHAQHPK